MKNLFITCICALLALPAGAATRRIAGGDDLGRAVRTLKDNDTLVVAAGSYVVEGTLPVKRNTVIVGEAGTRPRIAVGSFRIGTGAQHLVLRGLDLTLGTKYLVDTPSEGSVEIELVAIERCTVDLGGDTGAGLVGSRTSGTARNRIGEIRVEDCVVFNGGFPQHFVYSAASTSQTAVEKIRLGDSTFADMARGAVAANAAMKTRIEIERCTFYDINRSDNKAGTIRLSNATADIQITKSVFTFAGPASRFIIAGPGSKVAVENSWATGELTSIPGARGLKMLPAKASEAYEAPARNPLAEGVSLRLRENKAPGSEIGDPRWNK
ncbi:hypothetical protein [Alistipes timonensis]